MKKKLFLFSLVAVTVFIARATAQQYRTAPAVQIQPVVPVTQTIRIEVGQNIAKSVEVIQVPGNEIKVLPPPATVIYTPTPPPAQIEQHVHPHPETTPTPTTPAPRTTS
jgi:hypothetical protein